MSFKIFISYSWANDSERFGIISSLQKIENIEILYDKHSILKGEQIHKKISQLIDIADCILVLLTKDAITSVEVREELARSHERKKEIIPIVSSDIEIGNLPWFLRDANYINYNKRNFNELLNQIIDEVKTRKKRWEEKNANNKLDISNSIKNNESRKEKINSVLKYYTEFLKTKNSYEELVNNLYPTIVNIVPLHKLNFLYRTINEELRKLCQIKKISRKTITIADIKELINLTESKYLGNYSSNEKLKDIEFDDLKDIEDIKTFFDDNTFIKKLIAEFHPDKVYSKNLSDKEQEEEIANFTESFQNVIDLIENKDILGIMKEIIARNIDIQKLSNNDESISLEKIELILEKYNEEYWIARKSKLETYYSKIKVVHTNEKSFSIKDFHELINKNKQTHKNLKTELGIIIQRCDAISDNLKQNFENLILNEFEGESNVRINKVQ